MILLQGLLTKYKFLQQILFYHHLDMCCKTLAMSVACFHIPMQTKSSPEHIVPGEVADATQPVISREKVPM